MTTSAQVQAAVDELGVRLAHPVLIEDARNTPVWWSVQGDVDGMRAHSILDHRCHPAALSQLRARGLITAVGPVRTPAIPEYDMQERWCVPIRSGPHVVGYLWVIDGDHSLAEHDLDGAARCLDLALDLLVERWEDPDERLRERAALLERLVGGADRAAAEQLIALERLDPDVTVAVRIPGRPSGWYLPDGMSVHVDPKPDDGHTSWPPLPLADLSVAVERARVVHRCLAAGAVLPRPTWDALGSWRIIASADVTMSVAEVHPGAEVLAQLPRPELLVTARTVLDLGGDVGQAAEALHVHRTTLYYRLDRIEALTGVNLRSGDGRDDLHLALRLAAYQKAAAETARGA